MEQLYISWGFTEFKIRREKNVLLQCQLGLCVVAMVRLPGNSLKDDTSCHNGPIIIANLTKWHLKKSQNLCIYLTRNKSMRQTGVLFWRTPAEVCLIHLWSSLMEGARHVGLSIRPAVRFPPCSHIKTALLVDSLKTPLQQKETQPPFICKSQQEVQM